MAYFAVIKCDVPECTTSPFTYGTVVDVYLHYTCYCTNYSTFPSFNLVIYCNCESTVFIIYLKMNLPLLDVMLLSAPQPHLHILSLLMCVCIAFTIAPIAPYSPALTWLSTVIANKLYYY